MAENDSTFFNVHVPEFMDAIWVALTDPMLVVREKSIEALRACLRVIEKHKTRWRVQCLRLPKWIGEKCVCSQYTWIPSRSRGAAKICMNHILHVLKIPAERASGFIALGEIAGALDGELTNYLPTITSYFRDAIAPRRGRSSLEALACVENIAKAMGPTMEPHVRGLLDSIFSFVLSLTLVEALENRLLECISTILSRSHHSMPRQSASMSRGLITTVTPQVPELSGSVLVQLALRTLAYFNFKGYDLLEFARESVVVYLEDEDGATRNDTALCCCKLVANSFSAVSSTQFGPSRINRASGKRRRRLVEEVYF
ncbi:serine/threonine-protein kinase TOR-like isoform X1 [Capsicum galapagoense]